ncbi:hypothetical protein PanWU01x14_158870 [Parasponia andersonii]|uniref:Uncharacterized protein n=1 Tax=Parasponia andersonii TaxID=3476 RepID=A0A2P5CEP5_PARAD|nr:hypothetical protein PanWU01x14_158870 [Parasponia andersonii]
MAGKHKRRGTPKPPYLLIAASVEPLHPTHRKVNLYPEIAPKKDCLNRTYMLHKQNERYKHHQSSLISIIITSSNKNSWHRISIERTETPPEKETLGYSYLDQGGKLFSTPTGF